MVSVAVLPLPLESAVVVPEVWSNSYCAADPPDAVTISVAAVVVAGAPMPLLNTARYSLPFSSSVTLPMARVAFVAFGISLNEFPPSVLTCHCTVGDGVPLASAVNITSVPATSDCDCGLVVTTGAAPP